MRPIAKGIAVLALMGANPAFAQDGFRFTLPAEVTIGRDYGFLVHNNQKLSDTITMIRPPQLTFSNKSPRTDFTASYQPEIELFDNHRDLNALNHTGSASFTARITERLLFNVTNDALMTQDPTRSIAGSLAFLPRQSFKQNMAHVAVNYAVNRRNTVGINFDNVAATGGVRNAGTVFLAHAFGRMQTVTATYSRLEANAQFVGVAYQNQFGQDLMVHLSTGLLKDRGENYLLSGQVAKRLRAVWVGGGYNRFFSTFGTSISGGVPIGNDLVLPVDAGRTNVYQVLSTEVSGRVSSRVGLEMAAAVTKNSGTAGRDVNNVSCRFKLDVGITERLKILADLQLYNQSFTDYVGSAIARRRYLAGIQFDISPRRNLFNVPKPTKPTQR